MWRVDQNDLLILRDGTGRAFTEFVDALIRVHGFVYGVGEAEILSSLRVNIADGGIDTQVRRAMPNENTEFLRLPTCWQYKARRYAEISDAALLREISKPYAVQLIREGYAYRLGLCDDMPAATQTSWEQLLTKAARQINANAPEARVATASQLASWANSYPPLLPSFFPRDPGPVQYFDAWSPNITKTTPTFVPVDEWRSATELIERHINLTQSVLTPLITLQGMAGVGKTRLVYEIVAKLPGAKNLIFYTADGDHAENVARFLANDRKTRGVLVADECPVVARAGIMKILKGHAERVRVICIDNSGERLGSTQELWLNQLSGSAVEKVLEGNFPWVASDRRRTYADESRGYIRLAAGLCEHDAEIHAKGHFGPALNVLQEYYRERLNDEQQQRAVEAIALLQKVGFGEGVSEELDTLCAFTDLRRSEVQQTATKLKDAPGFIARTTRYLYVTPEIIARIAFGRAWRRWFELDPPAALRRLPPALISGFLARVARSATAEVRALTGQFFWQSVAELKPADLADEQAVERLATLINTDPDRYFPRLAYLVANATHEELLRSRGGMGISGSRRTLVWTAEHLLGFPKFFREAELILRKLALAETEERIGNNATGVWKEIFRIQLSGSANPFTERAEFLRTVLRSPDNAERLLAVEALKEALNLHGTRVVGPAVLGGHIVPPDWRPTSSREFQQCLEVIIELMDTVFEHGTEDMHQRAWTILATNLRPLLAYGMLARLRELVQRWPIPADRLPDILQSLEDFLQYECGGGTDSPESDPMCLGAKEWLERLTPTDFIGRLKAVVAKDPWHHSMREEISGIPSELMPLAEELENSAETLEAVLPFLNSPEAASASVFGDAVARFDPEAKHLDRVIVAAVRSQANAFARGYVGRLAVLFPASAARLNEWLDRLEKDAPELAYFLALAAPAVSRPLERTLRLISLKKLPIQSLQNFAWGDFIDQMASEQLTTVLDLLVQSGEPSSLHIAVDFVGRAVQKNRAFHSGERAAMWRVLAASAPIEDRSSYWWLLAIQAFAVESPERACDVAILALTGEGYDKRKDAWSVLAIVAKTAPDLVMERVGQILLNPEHGWRLRILARSNLFQFLPFDSVKNWLAAMGVEGARAIASHLQPPVVDSEGNARVDPCTEYVLATWGEDEAVFGRFVASTHNLQMYSGDIAAMHRKEAARARSFLSHPISAIRRWAEREVAWGEDQARQWAIRMEEQALE